MPNSYMDLERYAQLFEPKASLLSGDISPNYSTLSNEVIRRVIGYFPNLKVIFLARDPVERVWSHLSMEVRYRQVSRSTRPMSTKSIGICSVEGCCCARTRAQLSRDWKRYVHPDRFRIYFFDDLQRNPD